MRRRRVLSILTLSLLSVVALAGLGMLLWWTVAIPGALIVGFVVLEPGATAAAGSHALLPAGS